MTTSNYLYEILVRGDPDGLTGAYQIINTRDNSTGRVSLGEPEPLNLEDVQTVLGQSFGDLAPKLIAAQAKIEELTGIIEQLGGVIDSGLTWLQFLALFTPEEQLAVATSNDPQVSLFRLMASGMGGNIHLNDPRVAQGLDALIVANCIQPERKPAILEGNPLV